MCHRSRISSLTLCLLLWAASAHAQIGSFCLRPLGIPDKWVEMQTPPWDPTDTFDPTGPNPDVYDEFNTGFNPMADHGRAMSLVLYDRLGPPQGRSAWAIVVSEPGSAAFYDTIVACAGYPHSVGATFPSVTGVMSGPFGAAITDLIAQDPQARWEGTANGGRGGVVDSAFEQSPRVIALPVFAPTSYGVSTSTSPAMVKVVGFFVSSRDKATGAVHGYLTGWSRLTVPAVTARFGGFAQLTATLTGPGSPLMGVPIEFVYDGRAIATAWTDGTGTARPSTTAFQATVVPGEYPGAIGARIQDFSSFFIADEASGDLTVLKKLPWITWQPPADITYGTPLGPLQLNAAADIAGEFIYTPGHGAVLPVTHLGPISLSVMFAPAEEESRIYDQATATSYISVLPAPLDVRVVDTTKLYLDPLPPFSVSATGFVNGEGLSAITVSETFATAATAASEVGSYTVVPDWVETPNYAITLRPGMLTIVPRPTSTVLESQGPGSSMYGQPLSFTIVVSSGRGVPGGSVSLLSGDRIVGSAVLVDGRAIVDVPALDGGGHALSARYSGNGGFLPSTSSPIVHTVAAATTTTSLATSLNPSRTGQPVTFTAVVSSVAPGAGVPAGLVEFRRGGTVIGSAPLTGGTARLTIDTLTAGKHDIQAHYAGSGNHLASASAVVQQAVKGGGK